MPAPLRLSLLLLSALCRPAHAGSHERMALQGVITQAHDQGDLAALLGMMTATERQRAHAARLGDRFDRLLHELGITSLVTCTEERMGQAPPLPATGGVLRPPDEYRCTVRCRRGSYEVLLALSPPDPLVLPEPGPGRIHRVFLASALLDVTPRSWLPGCTGLDLSRIVGVPLAPAFARGYPLPLRPTAEPLCVRRSGTTLDLVHRFADGRTCRGSAAPSCRSFGEEVLAPLDGAVELAEWRHPDLPPGQRDRVHPAGNFLVLRDEERATFSVFTHLQQGSVLLRPGDRVTRGQPLARIGNSGDSDEPHLEMEIWSELMPLPGHRPPPCEDELMPGTLPIYLRGYVIHTLLGQTKVALGKPSCGQLISAPPSEGAEQQEAGALRR